MKKNFTQQIIGLVIITIGGLVLANNLGVIHFTSWDLLMKFIWVGVCLLIVWQAIRAKAWLGALIFGSIAISSMLAILGLVVISFWKIFWPLVLVLVGCSFIFKTGGKKTKTRSSSNLSAIFWGEEAVEEGEYTGGNITAIFGGVELDLTGADIKDGSVIEVFVMFGGAEIYLPDDVAVDNQAFCMLGGIDHSRNSDRAKKTVIVRGQCMFGGVDFRGFKVKK